MRVLYCAGCTVQYMYCTSQDKYHLDSVLMRVGRYDMKYEVLLRRTRTIEVLSPRTANVSNKRLVCSLEVDSDACMHGFSCR
jgi:hypothetical protein